jgi:predicted DNA-binding transcriptional regulator AlpA
MTDINVFYELKKSVLEHYKKRYPYFEGSWKNFTSQDILNLIDDVQVQTKNSVSEKWIYTHFKPETNEKLPRKDMLDIFSQYIGTSGWDEFKFQPIDNNDAVNQVTKSSNKKKYFIFGCITFVLFGSVFWKMYNKNNQLQTIQLEEKFSNDSISSSSTKVYVVEDKVEKEVELKDSKIEVDKNAQVVIKSPFYKEKKIDLTQTPNVDKVSLQPNDYSNILQGFIKSDIKDWQTRKEQLQKILHDNVEVIVMLKNNLGAEYFNKNEFSQKLIIPTPSLKKMKIVEVINDKNNQITFIRIIQE